MILYHFPLSHLLSQVNKKKMAEKPEKVSIEVIFVISFKSKSRL